jgi:MYXO-CTERM domain-containing protein
VNDGDEVDAGTDPLDPTDDVQTGGPGAYFGGCGACSTGGSPAGGVAGLLLLGGMLARRRRR